LVENRLFDCVTVHLAITVPACDIHTNIWTDEQTDGHTTTAYTVLAQHHAVIKTKPRLSFIC